MPRALQSFISTDVSSITCVANCDTHLAESILQTCPGTYPARNYTASVKYFVSLQWEKGSDALTSLTDDAADGKVHGIDSTVTGLID